MKKWKGEKCLSTMRQSFHRALTTCRAPLPAGKKYVAVQFLTKELIFYVVDAKGKGQEIFDEASKHLGLLDAELFGLAFHQDGDFIFIDLNLKLSKYAARNWKTHCNGIGGDGLPLLVLHMRIKYYVDCHLLINEKVCRQHYYLQLRENVKNYFQPVSEERLFLLAALALQADLGNYNEEKHRDRYFEIGNYFPSWVIKKIGEDFIICNVPGLHKDNAGLSRGEAQVGYIKEASDAAAPHNLHFYRMRRKKGKLWNYVWLGIRDSGIHIYEDSEGTRSLLSTFLWCDIAKLHFEKKKFEILSEGSPEYRRFTYFVDSEELAKQLLLMCRMTHHFHMSNQNRVEDLKKLELDGGKKPYREAYIYTDEDDKDQEIKLNSLQKVKTKSKIESSSWSSTNPKESPRKENAELFHSNSPKSQNGIPVSQHLSLETLPLGRTSKLSSEMKYRSQSIPCLPHHVFTPHIPAGSAGSSSQLCCPTQHSTSTTPTATLLSHGSCASNTNSTCSSLSLTSSSTLKVTDPRSHDNAHWVKCDSFEELSVPETPEKVLHKVCISTFMDKHVRTASVYDAITTNIAKPGRSVISCSQTNIPHATSKVVDVKRSPSFNTCSPTLSEMTRQRPVRQHPQAPSHGRMTTRIGISSLNRDQRLPLTLFNDRGMLGCGSEPNLYVPIDDPKFVAGIPLSHAKQQWLKIPENSRSELSLDVLNSTMPNPVEFFCVKSLNAEHCNLKNMHLSLPDVCNDVLDGMANFPFIPPPPAYRNNMGHPAFSPFDNSAPDLNLTVEQPKLEHCHVSPATVSRLSEHQRHPLNVEPDPPPDVLDLHQLRQRSKDLDLPLISALCNDRSLLMLPKTVPTCSRQRHLAGKDPLRFGRTTSLPNGDGIDPLLVNHGRPISWHVDSTRVPHWPEVAKPCSASWDNSVTSQHVLVDELRKPRSATYDGRRTPVPLTAGVRSFTVPVLPPTILTSFAKTPVRQVRSRDLSYSDIHRCDQNQMIPTKLLAGPFNCIPNGRLYQKGSSS